MTITWNIVRKLANVDPVFPSDWEKLGLARSARTATPIHGVRVVATDGITCGWYIWAGDYSADPDFFEATHVEHLPTVCPLAVPFLALPPGWRFLTDGDYFDVWFEPHA